MSSLSKLRNKDGDISLDGFPTILLEYKKKLADWKRDLSLKDRNLNDVLIEQHSTAAYYDEIKAELSTLSDYIQLLIDERVGIINEKIKEHSRFDHSDRSVDKLIGKDERYIMLARLKIEINELYKKTSYICRQFENRSYTLGNLVKMFINELQDTTLTKEYD